MKGKEDQEQKEGIIKEDFVPELKAVIENIAKKEGYITYDITTTKFYADGINFLGELFELDLKGKTADGEKETNLFLKKLVGDRTLGDLLGVANTYVTETFVYQDLARVFYELQSEAHIPEEERYKMVKFYENSEPTTIILENMAKKAFAIPQKMEVVSLKYAELCIEQLAKFHALSFALKLKDPHYYENKICPNKYPIRDDEASRITWENIAKITSRNLDSVYKQKAEKVKAAFYEKFKKYYVAEFSSVTCLCHGDFKAPNILMKENEGEVVEVIPIDYQFINVGCPINDFLYFIALGTDRKFRDQHFENLKTLYYDTLTNFLKYFNIDSNDVFPRKEMDDIFRQRMDYVAMVAVFGFVFIFAPKNTLNLNEAITEGNLELDERYKERLIEILDDIPL